MNRTHQIGAILCLLFATIAWGGLFHVGKAALNNLDPFWFTAVRYISAAALLVFILLFSCKPQWNFFKQHWLRLTGLGVLGYAVFGIMVFVGLNMSVPSHGAVIMATMPITSLFVAWIFDNKRPELWAWVVGGLAILGVGFVSGAWELSQSSDDSSLLESTLLGDMIAFLGTIGWVLYSRGQKQVPELSVVEFTAFTTFLAFPLIVTFAWITSLIGLSTVPSSEQLAEVTPSMFYVVVFATVLSGLAFNRGVRTLGAHQGIVFINFVPISAWVISISRGDTPSVTELIGTVIVICALGLQAYMTSGKAIKLDLPWIRAKLSN